MGDFSHDFDFLEDDSIDASFQIISELNALDFFYSNKKFEMKKHYESKISISLRPLSVVVVSSCLVCSTTLPTASSAVENKGLKNTSQNTSSSSIRYRQQKHKKSENLLNNLGKLFIVALISLLESQKKEKKLNEQILVTQAFLQKKLPKPFLIHYSFSLLKNIYPSIPFETKVFISLSLLSFLSNEIVKEIYRNRLEILQGGQNSLPNRQKDLINGMKIGSFRVLLTKLLLQLFLGNLVVSLLYFLNVMGDYWITGYVNAQVSKDGFFLEYLERADALENFSLRLVLLFADLRGFILFVFKLLVSACFLVNLTTIFLLLKNIRDTYVFKIHKQSFKKPLFLTEREQKAILCIGVFLIYSIGFSSLAKNLAILVRFFLRR